MLCKGKCRDAAREFNRSAPGGSPGTGDEAEEVSVEGGESPRLSGVARLDFGSEGKRPQPEMRSVGTQTDETRLGPRTASERPAAVGPVYQRLSTALNEYFERIPALDEGEMFPEGQPAWKNPSPQQLVLIAPALQGMSSTDVQKLSRAGLTKTNVTIATYRRTQKHLEPYVAWLTAEFMKRNAERAVEALKDGEKLTINVDGSVGRVMLDRLNKRGFIWTRYQVDRAGRMTTNTTGKRNVHCGLCGVAGHTRTTCRRRGRAEKRRPEDSREQTGKAKRARRARKRGACGSAGHDKRNCAQVPGPTRKPGARKRGQCDAAGHNARTCPVTMGGAGGGAET